MWNKKIYSIGADVEYVEELFNTKQLAELALLKSLIEKVRNKAIRQSLLLCFYNTLSVINLTFHSTPKGGGNHFGFYYRYRMAKEPTFKDTLQVFETKFKRVLKAKQEMEVAITKKTIKNAKMSERLECRLHARLDRNHCV